MQRVCDDLGVGGDHPTGSNGDSGPDEGVVSEIATEKARSGVDEVTPLIGFDADGPVESNIFEPGRAGRSTVAAHHTHLHDSLRGVGTLHKNGGEDRGLTSNPNFVSQT